MNIIEIFMGREGEGLQLGIPKVFIRTGKCSVGCKHCDTAFQFKNAAHKNVDDIVYKVNVLAKANSIKWITLTGGEPLEEDPKELRQLVNTLKSYNFKIALETSGQFKDKYLFKVCDFLSVDAKSPSSGVIYKEKVHDFLWSRFKKKTQVKIIVDDLNVDPPFVFNYLRKFNPPLDQVIVTVGWNINESLNDVREKAKIISELPFPTRVIIQQHKIIYGPKIGGV